jgi:hypothetical protein
MSKAFLLIVSVEILKKLTSILSKNFSKSFWRSGEKSSNWVLSACRIFVVEKGTK